MNAGDEMVRGLGEVLSAHDRVDIWHGNDADWGRPRCTCGDFCPLTTSKSNPDSGWYAPAEWHRAHVAEALAAHVLGLVTAGKAEALREAADEMDAVIADGDVAEVAAFVPGEVGRSEAVHRRDALYEEPATWLRDRADGLAGEAS